MSLLFSLHVSGLAFQSENLLLRNTNGSVWKANYPVLPNWLKWYDTSPTLNVTDHKYKKDTSKINSWEMYFSSIRRALLNSPILLSCALHNCIK